MVALGGGGWAVVVAMAMLWGALRHRVGSPREFRGCALSVLDNRSSARPTRTTSIGIVIGIAHRGIGTAIGIAIGTASVIASGCASATAIGIANGTNTGIAIGTRSGGGPIGAASTWTRIDYSA